jgi:hypothetical protein
MTYRVHRQPATATILPDRVPGTAGVQTKTQKSFASFLQKRRSFAFLIGSTDQSDRLMMTHDTINNLLQRRILKLYADRIGLA